MFCIYGRSRVSASKFIDKKLLGQNSDVSKEIVAAEFQIEKQVILDRYIDEYFKVMPIRRCSHELSTPELAKELIDLMSGHEWFSDLRIMKKTPKILPSGKISVSKTTGKTRMDWIALNDS